MSTAPTGKLPTIELQKCPACFEDQINTNGTFATHYLRSGLRCSASELRIGHAFHAATIREKFRTRRAPRPSKVIAAYKAICESPTEYHYFTPKVVRVG